MRERGGAQLPRQGAHEGRAARRRRARARATGSSSTSAEASAFVARGRLSARDQAAGRRRARSRPSASTTRRRLRHALDAAPPARRRRRCCSRSSSSGDEHSLETISIDGTAVWHSLTHYYPDAARGRAQSVDPVVRGAAARGRRPALRRHASAVGDRALHALGMTTGLSHMEWFRRRDGSVAIGEVAARPPGAQITTLVSRATDIDFVRELGAGDGLRHASRRPSGSTRRASPSSAAQGRRAAASAPCTASTGAPRREGPRRATPSSRRRRRGRADATRATATSSCATRRPTSWSRRCATWSPTCGSSSRDARLRSADRRSATPDPAPSRLNATSAIAPDDGRRNVPELHEEPE